MKQIIYTIFFVIGFCLTTNNLSAQSLTCAGASSATLTENPTQGGTVTLGPFSNAGQSEHAFNPWTETAGDVVPSGWNAGGALCGGLQTSVGQPVYFEFTPLFTGAYEIQVPGGTIQTNAQGNDVADDFCTGTVMDTEFAIFTGTCGNLSEVYSLDDYGGAGACNAGAACADIRLTAGVTYTIVIDGATYLETLVPQTCQVDYSQAGTSVGMFNIQITSAGPSQDCTTAQSLPVNTTCSTTTFSSTMLCPSIGSCGGATDDDAAWFSFVATQTNATIMVDGNDNVLAVYDNCGGAELGCSDAAGTSETLVLANLAIGSTYYILVSDFGAGTITDNTICVTAVPPAPCPDKEFTTPGAACSGSTIDWTAGANCDVNGPAGTAFVVDLFVYDANDDNIPDLGGAPAGYEATIDVSSPTHTTGAGPAGTEITVKNPALTDAGFDFTCADPPSVTLPVNNTCAPIVYTYFLAVFDYANDTDNDGLCLAGANCTEYAPNCTVERYDVTVFPAPLTIVVTDDGTSCGTPSVELRDAAGNACSTQSGIGNGAGATGACVNNGDALNWDFSADPIITALSAAPAGCVVPATLSGTVTCSACAPACNADSGTISISTSPPGN